MAGYDASDAAEKSGLVPLQERLRLLWGRPSRVVLRVRALPVAAVLLVLRPLTEVENGGLDVGAHRLTVQQLWGAAFLLTLLRLLAPVERGRQARVAVVSAAVAFAGILGALLGPAHGSALRAWFWVWLAVLTLLVARERADALPPRRVAAVFAAAAGVVFLVVLVNGYGSTGRVVQSSSFVSQLSAGFVSPHTLAFASVGLLPWALVLALGRGRVSLLVGIAVGAGLLAIIFLTTIRTAQLAVVPLVVSGGLAFALRAPPGSRLRTVAPAAVGALLATVVIASAAVPSIRVRWTGIFNGPEPGLQWAGSGRGWLWRQALVNFEHAPLVNKLFGSGVTATSILTERRIGTPFAAHSDVLELLVALGIVGFAALAVALGLFVRELVRGRAALRSSGIEWLWVVTLGGFLAGSVCGLLTGFMTYTTGAISVAVLLGMTLGIARLEPAAASALSPDRSPLQMPVRRAALIASLAGGAVVAIVGVLVAVEVGSPRPLPAPPTTLVLATPPADPLDPAVTSLIEASKWVQAPQSASQAAGVIRAFLHVPAVAGSLGRPTRPGTIVVDPVRTVHGTFVAYARGTSGTSWVVVKQPSGRPAVAPVGSYFASVLLDRPLAYWPLADDDALARDYSGHGNHGEYSASGISGGLPGVLGAFDRSAYFDGVSGSVSVRVPEVSRSSGAITTVELWLRPARWAQAEFVFGFPFYGLYERGSSLGFNTGNSGDLYGARVPHLTDRWHYVVARFCNGSVRCGSLFVDGQRLPLRQLSGRSVPQRVGSDARVSGWPATPGTTYRGQIEQVAVYGYSLPASRIRAHYAAARRQPRSLVAGQSAAAPLVLATQQTSAADPGLAALVRAVAAARSAQSAAAAVTAIGPSALVGTAATVVTPGTVVVDGSRTHGGALVAYARGARGVQWLAVRQPHGQPAFAPVGSYAANVLLASPRAYWPLGDTGSVARDYSGRGQSGLFAGGVGYATNGALGKRDRSAWFYADGGGTVSVPVGGLSTRPGRVTSVELWMRPDPRLAWAFVFGFPFYGLYERGSTLGFNTGDNGDLLGAVIPRLRGRWHHVVAEFCNGSVRCTRLYVDGRLVRLRQMTGRPVPQHVSDRANISGWPSTPGAWFSGGIEQVAVYEGALGPAEVRAHYDAALRERRQAAR